MKHNLLGCQVLVNGKNTAAFWNRNLSEKAKVIIDSPIYIKKNKIVLKILSRISGKLLDVGFGYGYIEELITKNNLDLKLHGIDISNYAVANAIRKFQGKFVVSNIYDIPFKKASFDCVLALDILEHISKRHINKALCELNRVLKRNGLLIVSVPLNESLEDRLNNRHLRSYTEKLIKSDLIKGGFLVDRTHHLTAFNSLFEIKSYINSMIKLKEPNLLILICHKK